MNHPDGMTAWWMNGWSGLVAILLIVALIAILVWTITRTGRDTPSGTNRSDPDALDILEQRFARGEIDQDEFASRRAALRDGES